MWSVNINPFCMKKDMTMPSSLWSSECLWNLGPQSGVCTPAGSISLGLADTKVSGPAIISTELEPSSEHGAQEQCLKSPPGEAHTPQV